jgi:CheY-like chemotaxis protein
MTAPKLLLVEDDIFIGMDMAHTLSESGYEPVHAKNLDEAEHAIGTDDFAAIVLDFRVGNDDTIHFARKLRGVLHRLEPGRPSAVARRRARRRQALHRAATARGRGVAGAPRRQGLHRRLSGVQGLPGRYAS